MEKLFKGRKIEDLSGQRFSYLLVKNYSHLDDKNCAVWNVVCDCGMTKKVSASSLKKRGTKTCGKCHLWKSLITRRFYE